MTTAPKALKDLVQNFHNKTAIIGIIGMGYVGLPLALRYAEAGFKVVGLDINSDYVNRINASQSYITHIPAEKIESAVKSKKLVATLDYQELQSCDAIIICVPTPLSKHRDPDLSYVINTTDAILPHLRAGQIVSLESTTYPGTTDEELLPRLESRGFKVGRDLFLVFSPEREDPGNPKFHTQTIPKVCGGVTPQCLELGIALYSGVIDQVVPVSSTRAAEMTKLLENIHRAVNIGLVNEMKIVADKMDIDIYEVIQAAATKPFGFTAYYPGPGLGGHCIPIDPFYLTWKAKEYGMHTKFIELAGEINTSMPNWVVEKLTEALNQRLLSVKNARILVMGIAYKKNINDMRESPAVQIMEILRAKGAQIQYCDPFVPVFPKMREHQFDLTSVKFSAAEIAAYDCVLLATNHDLFDYDLLLKSAKLIVDTRGVYRTPNAKVVKA